MKIGEFLDSLPSGLYMVCHVIFLIIGLWVYRKAKAAKLAYAPAFLLYALTQVAFVAMFMGYMRIKTAVLFEQTCILIIIIWIVVKANERKVT